MTRSIVVRLVVVDDVVRRVGVSQCPENLAQLLEQASVRTREWRGRGRPRGTTILQSIADVFVVLDAAKAAGIPLHGAELGTLAKIAGVSEHTLDRFLASYGLRIIGTRHPATARPPSEAA